MKERIVKCVMYAVGLLTVAFVVLKFSGVIDWSWWLVLSPTLIVVSIELVLLISVAILVACVELIWLFITLLTYVTDHKYWRFLKNVKEQEGDV